MIEYEYLYFPGKNRSSDCSPLCGDDTESLFVKHHRVIRDLQAGEDRENFGRLVRTMEPNGKTAIKIRLEVEPCEEAPTENTSMTGDFEKLLHQAILGLISHGQSSCKASEGNSSVTAEIVETIGDYRRPKRRRIVAGQTHVPSSISNRPSELTRTAQECDSSSAMHTRHKGDQKKFDIKTSTPSNDAVFEELRLSRPDDKDSGRLRDNLSEVIRSLSFLEAKTSDNGQLLSFATELNTTFVEFVAHWLRPDIEPIERSINERLADLEPSTLPQKQEFAKSLNAELRSLGLAIRCPKTNRPSILLANPANHPAIGRFQLQHRGMDGKPKRPFSTANLKSVILMPDIPPFDIQLSIIFSKLLGQRTLTTASI